MNDTVQTLIRAVLKIAAGYFISKGLIDDSHSEEIIATVTAAVATIWGVWHRTPAPPSTNAGPRIPLMLILALPVAVMLMTGCHTPKMEPGGAYAPANQATEPELYVADASYKLAYDTVDGILKYERDNRAQLAAISPAIKAGLDKIRPTVWEVDQRWALARKAYQDHPTPANLNTVQLVLAEIQRLVPVAQSQIAVAYAKPQPK